MWKNLKWLRIVPDRAGRGGSKTGIHSFQQTPINDVRTLTNAHVYRGHWRRDYDPVLYSGEVPDANGVRCLAIHGYTFPSLTNPAAPPTIKILTQNVHLGGVTVVYDMNGTTRQSRPGTTQQGVFFNIAGRCLFGDGGTEALMMDDRTPAIHAQPNQPLGIEAPKQPMTLLGSTGYTSMGSCYAFKGSGFLTHPNPDHPIGTIKAGDTVRPKLMNPNYPQYIGALMADWTVVVDGESSNTTNFGNAGTISIDPAVDPSLVTITGGTWPATFGACGLSINFNGYSFVVNGHNVSPRPDINGVLTSLSSVTLSILGVYDGPKISGVSYTLTGCRVTMGDVSSLWVGNTNAAWIPPSLALGYSQNTLSNLTQILVLVERANGLYRNMGWISLGPAGGGVPDTITNGSIPSGVTQVYSASAPWTSTDVTKTIVIDHAGDAAGTTMLVTTISSVILPAFANLNDASQNTGIVTGARVWWVPNAIGVGDAAIATGTPTLTSVSNPWTPSDQGKEVIVAGAGPGGTGDALFAKILTYNSAGSVTLDTNASATVTGKQAYWGGAISGAHTGPTYAYAWYDPETGHMSNISPLVTIPRPITQGNYADFSNLTPVFKIDPGAMAYPNQATDGIRFSHIVFFRTVSTGGSTLYPIGSLQPFVGKVHPGGASTRGSWNPSTFKGWMGLPNNTTDAPPINFPNLGNDNVWYDLSSDSDLLLSGGFRAPQFTNEKPMVLLRGGATQPGYPYALQYWDRRTWLVNTQEPNKIVFSCDEAQCPLGLPEESFPPTNFLRLPSAADGKVIGMRTIGDLLFITTQRYAYIVVGNNESNYRLMKISSSMPGVGTYQMDEFPTYTGAEGEPTTVFYLGTDRIVYQWTLGGAVTPISQPIQDQLDRLLVMPNGQYVGSLVHCISAWGRRLVVVVPNQIFGGNGVLTFMYDLNNQTWSSSIRSGASISPAQGGGIVPMTTVFGASGAPVDELYGILTAGTAPGVHAVSWIRDDGATASQPMILQTFPLSFDGLKARKQIVAVNIHASAGVWTGAMVVNDNLFTAPFTFATYPDPIESIYAPTGIQSSPSLDVAAQDIVCMAGKFNTDGTPVIGYRFSVYVNKVLPDSDPAHLYAIDVAYVDAETPGEGDA